MVSRNSSRCCSRRFSVHLSCHPSLSLFLTALHQNGSQNHVPSCGVHLQRCLYYIIFHDFYQCFYDISRLIRYFVCFHYFLCFIKGKSALHIVYTLLCIHNITVPILCRLQIYSIPFLCRFRLKETKSLCKRKYSSPSAGRNIRMRRLFRMSIC